MKQQTASLITAVTGLVSLTAGIGLAIGWPGLIGWGIGLIIFNEVIDRRTDDR